MTIIFIHSHIKRWKIIEQLTVKQFNDQVRPVPLLFHDKWKICYIWSYFKVLHLHFMAFDCYILNMRSNKMSVHMKEPEGVAKQSSSNLVHSKQLGISATAKDNRRKVHDARNIYG